MFSSLGSKGGSTTNGSLFGGNTNPSVNNSTGTSLFGGNNATSTNTPSLLNNTTSSNSLFGNKESSNTTSSGFGTSLFGGNNSSSGTQKNVSLNFSSPVNTNQSQESQSLFGMSSAFSYSNDKNEIHNLAEQKLRECAPPSTGFQNNASPSTILPASSSVANTSSYSSQLPQTQSNSYGLGAFNSINSSTLSLNSKAVSSPYRKPLITPSWAQDKRSLTAHSSLKHVSSFTKNDRVPSTPSHRKSSVSPSQSPSTSFGTSFSGVSKPTTRKKTFAQEDPPPTKSIYDLDTSNLSHFKNDDSASINSDISRQNSLSNSSGSANHVSSQVVDSVSVIIFGFPAFLTPAVVSYFARFGNILENIDSARKLQSNSKGNKVHTPIHTGKNWLKITYDNSFSASRAIQENGTIFDGQYIIGCFPVTSNRLKEFEKACESSTETSDFSSNTSHFDFTPVEKSNSMDSRFKDSTSKSATDENSENTSDKSVFKNSKNSTPIIAGSKRANIKDGRHIFNTPAKQMRFSSPLFKMSQEHDGSKGDKTDGKSQSKGLKSNNLGWMSWTGKKAQELVFGWDDL